MKTPPVSVSREISASADELWAMISDVTRMGEWSPEATSCRWTGGATGPTVGAKFWGVSKNRWHVWATKCSVTDCEPGKTFAFDVDLVVAISNWAYTFEPTENGTLVTETWTDRGGWLIHNGGVLVHGVRDRAPHNEAGMIETLAGLAAVAEATVR